MELKFIALILYSVIILGMCVMLFVTQRKKETPRVHYVLQETARNSWLKFYLSYSQIVELINILWEFNKRLPKGYTIPEGVHEELYKTFINGALSLEERTKE